MLEILSFYIDIEPWKVDKLLELERESSRPLLYYFDISEVVDGVGGVDQNTSWAEYEYLMDDLRILQEYAEYIEVEIVNEDTHIFYKIEVLPDKILRYTGDVVYNDLPEEI